MGVHDTTWGHVEITAKPPEAQYALPKDDQPFPCHWTTLPPPNPKTAWECLSVTLYENGLETRDNNRYFKSDYYEKLPERPVFQDMACMYLWAEGVGKYMKNTESELVFVEAGKFFSLNEGRKTYRRT